MAPTPSTWAPSAKLTRMPNLVFSLCAALACLIVTILAAAKGAPVVALVWGLLALGFLGRAAYGYGRMRKG
jgi:4-hydroxybenzoate polyprenyltransferase